MQLRQRRDLMHILFDLDGTLTDSRPGILKSIRHALEENGLTAPSEADMQWCIGPPILETFGKLVSPTAPEKIDAVVASFRARYGSIGLFENSVFPEIESTLTALQAAGHTLHVATSKMEPFAVRVLDHFNLARFFVSIDGSDYQGNRADKGDLIAHILREQAIVAKNAVMIGDRSHDMHGAAKNGVASIGVLWGYGSGAELVQAGATLTARVPRLLPELVGSLYANFGQRWNSDGGEDPPKAVDGRLDTKWLRSDPIGPKSTR